MNKTNVLMRCLLFVGEMNKTNVLMRCLLFVGALLIGSLLNLTHNAHAGLALATAATLPESTIKEFKDLLEGIKTGQKSYEEKLQKLLTDHDAGAKLIKQIEEESTKLRSDLDKLRKIQLEVGIGKGNILRPGQVVNDDCAKFLGAICCAFAQSQGKLTGNSNADKIIGVSKDILGAEIFQRAALTTTDIPMPVNYAAQVVELVWKYGQFRQYATVYPLSALTTKLPKLTTDPAFGFIAQSAAIGEKSPQIAFVTFTAQKAGGIVRIPSEIEADSIVNLGQFLARYIARQFAKWEDTTGFLADGTATYGSPAISGVGKTADVAGTKLQLTAGNSNPGTITLANMRTLRSKVDGAVLPTSAYYMHPTMESLLVSFNTSATVTPYIANGPNGPTLDGFPIRWVGVMPVNDTTAHVNQYQVYFGDMSYWYLGDRNLMSIEQSRDFYFNTDEIGLRALERFDCELMGAAAVAVLQLSAT